MLNKACSVPPEYTRSCSVVHSQTLIINCFGLCCQFCWCETCLDLETSTLVYDILCDFSMLFYFCIPVYYEHYIKYTSYIPDNLATNQPTSYCWWIRMLSSVYQVFRWFMMKSIILSWMIILNFPLNRPFLIFFLSLKESSNSVL